MPFLHQTATYTVLTPSGEKLQVDEFEPAEPRRLATITHSGRKQLMLRNGAIVRFIDDRTFQNSVTGEKLTILSKQK